MGFLDDYEPVEDRLRAFWSEHPKGRVITALIHHGEKPGHVLVFRADIYRELDPDGEPASTGYAHQRLFAEPPMARNGKPNDSAPEWTSPWEVAETSAVGRALANLGYAAKGKRPSREEMSKTIVGDGLKEAGPRSQSQGPSPAPSSPGTEQGSATTDGESPVVERDGNWVTAERVGVADGEAAPSPLDQLYSKFGNGNKALLAARKYYSDDPPKALVDLSASRIAELLERV